MTVSICLHFLLCMSRLRWPIGSQGVAWSIPAVALCRVESGKLQKNMTSKVRSVFRSMSMKLGVEADFLTLSSEGIECADDFYFRLPGSKKLENFLEMEVYPTLSYEATDGSIRSFQRASQVPLCHLTLIINLFEGTHSRIISNAPKHYKPNIVLSVCYHT